jgi:hypothetical protein
MKRCAKCKTEYEDSYDACPECAKGIALEEKGRSAGCLLGIAVLVGLLLWCNSWFSPGDDSLTVEDDPGLADAAAAAIDADIAPYIHSVTAETDGDVVVQISVTKDVIGGISGDLGVRDFAYLVGEDILGSLPEAQSVLVLDADSRVMDQIERK